MAYKGLLAALCTIAAASPLAAASQQPAPHPTLTPGAPAGAPDTRYCMRIEAVTGTHIEEVKCWTRQEWAEQGVDLDEEWPKEGVRIVAG